MTRRHSTRMKSSSLTSRGKRRNKSSPITLTRREKLRRKREEGG